MAWSCTPGRFEWHYAVDETVHIISGEVFVTDEHGKVHRLGPGDMAFFPAGSHCVWRVTKEVRKLAVCRHSMPRPFGLALRAWNKVVHRLTGFPTGGGLEADLATNRSSAPAASTVAGSLAAATHQLIPAKAGNLGRLETTGSLPSALALCASAQSNPPQLERA
jgi:hypothetical protein